MLRAETFFDILSGTRRGPAAWLLRSLLGMAGFAFGQIVWLRNLCYDWGLAKVHRMAVPVVSVGNLTLGGTGKTPAVAWLARWFQQHGVRVAVLSRGYGAQAGSPNDEAMELQQSLPNVPHLQNPDRVAAAQTAIGQGARLILLDDAMQHRRIGRNLEIVLLDASAPFGIGSVFPGGTLREPVRSVRRADIVILSRADMLEPSEREQVWTRVNRWAAKAVYAEAAHAPVSLRSASGITCQIDALAGKPVAAFCAIGNPTGFRHTLAALGVAPVGFRVFPDHHRYSKADVASLTEWAEQLGAAAIVCTHKDLVKLGTDTLGTAPLWAVAIELRFLGGQEAVERQLKRLLPACSEQACSKQACSEPPLGPARHSR
ncbi:MAG: tetraacyldisaccharide 4'-kinase [Patescibacteria group bacterium]|nr:tetraacyldisaccharide 4'-kinase [Patescibacteria group bacterium]